VRVNDRGPFTGGRVIDLSREGARQLGFEKTGSARVRVRYVGPAPLGGPDAGVRYAAAAPVAPSPSPASLPPAAAAAPYTASRGPAYVTPSTPMDEPPGTPVRAPAKVAATALPPTPAPPAPVSSPPPAGRVFRVQAGAFGDQANAQRAASQLTSAGGPVIEPVERDGATLYRVMLQASADEADAWALRDRVAAAGFVDARVIRPF
jgi:rare lipoprotein A